MSLNRIVILISIAFSTLILSSFRYIPSSVPGNAPAIVTKVVKEVKHKKPKKDWNITLPATELENNDQLMTGDRSLAVLRFIDGSSLRVRENTIITVYANRKERGLIKTTKMELGKMRFDVEKQHEEDEFIITTPTAVATIRGTSGIIEVLDDGQTLLVVESGVVEVRALTGAQQSDSVEEGNSTLISSDGIISISKATTEQLNESRNFLRTKEKSLLIQTPQGNFRIYYLDFEE